MDRNAIFGGSPFTVALRLVILSIVVGMILDTFGINFRNFFDSINALLRGLYDLGFEAFDWIVQYLLLGALVVVPIWILTRVAALLRGPRQP